MGKTWDAPGVLGVSGGVAMPSTTSSRNPSCRNCGGRKRAGPKTKSCSCEDPDWNEHEYRQADRAAFVGFLQAVMAECLRVLKPGGHALVWSLPRTSHWTALAIENAGFELVDAVHHVFGCLSDDTEILTETGWEPYHTLVEGRLALCYDAEHGDFRWQPIQQVYIYPYRDTAYRLRGDRTDQIVSRNHRCLVERGGAYAFEYAEALQREEGVPVLEDVLGLLRAVPLPHGGTGTPEQDVLARVLGQERRCQELRASDATCDVSGVWPGVPTQEQRLNEAGQILHLEVQGSDSGGRPQGTCSTQDDRQARAQGVDRSRSGSVHREDDGSAQSRMEGRGDVLLEARELRVGEVRPVPAGVPSDGPQGRVRRGASAHRGDGGGSLSLAVGDGASRQPQPHGQPAREPASLRLESGSQAVRGARFTRTDLVRVEPIDYDGIVWCVRVPSGSFVARRAGKAFVTGNSGFPKSLNIGKAIDKMAGAERPVVGSRTFEGKAAQDWKDWKDKEGHTFSGGGASAAGLKKTVDVTAPATPEAKRWDGWGTALKPAVETWYLCRKPVEVDQGGLVPHAPVYAAPFIYTGKASKVDKNADLEEEGLQNRHPTVKSQTLMSFLVRLVTPPGGVVLDPFAGSGSTLVATITEGMKFLGVEQEAEYFQFAKTRTDKALGRVRSEAAQRAAFDMMSELPQE